MEIKVFYFGKNLATQMKAELPGDYVACFDLGAYGELANMVFMAGSGDYLEIGTWRGTSAIIAAKTKEEYGISGNIVCVDHFKGYTNENSALIRSQAEDTMKKYGVFDKIEIFEQPSRPMPLELKTRTFACALIDGNHWKENPYLDFLEIESLVENYIMFDDYDDEHKDVMDAVERASKSENWSLVSTDNSAAVLERI